MHNEAVVAVGKVVVSGGEMSPSVEEANRPVQDNKAAVATSRTAVHSNLTRAVADSNDGDYSALDRSHQLLPVKTT